MNSKDREMITAQCAQLVPNIDWVKIWPKLFEHQIYRTKVAKILRWERTLTDPDTQREIYLGIKRRGPDAFQNFIRCLIETGHTNLASILTCGSANNVTDDIPTVLREYNGNSTIVNTIDETRPTPVDIVDDNIPLSCLTTNEVNAANNAINNQENVPIPLTGTNTENLGNHDTINHHISTGIEVNESRMSPVDNFFATLQHRSDILKVNVRKATRFMDIDNGKVMRYAMRSNPRGLVLIITNIMFTEGRAERRAAEHDERNLKTLFEQMGFEVESHFNKRAQEIESIVENFSKRPDLKKVHSMFVIIMSHGTEQLVGPFSETVVCGIDNEFIQTETITHYFSAVNCPYMARKPKIFLFQACRGIKQQENTTQAAPVSVDRSSFDTCMFVKKNEDSVRQWVRKHSDVLIIHSTLPGYVAYHDTLTGSWYIQILCEVFMNHAWDTELLDLLQMTDHRLARMENGSNKCQTSVFMDCGFNRKCYLNPGYFETDADT